MGPVLHADSADISSTDILKRGFGPALERRVPEILCYGDVGPFSGMKREARGEREESGGVSRG